MSQGMLEILRDRVATGFYERPGAVDALARALAGHTWSGAREMPWLAHIEGCPRSS